ncbi:MAG: hypothetical protein RIC95_14785 [Vicingaceae bacterium]
MKKNSIYLFVLFFAMTFAMEADAQLSDRINNPSTIKAGARPVAGNFGFYLGLELDQFGDLFDQATEVEDAIPLINVRYYLRDDLVVRAGISIWKRSRTLEGEIDTSTVLNDPFLNGGQGFGATYEHKEVDAYTLIHLGAEKHFKASNLLDGYVGASIPLGYTRGALYTNNNGVDGSADYQKVTTTRFSFVYGAELFVGANAFVADLPLAIGVELGIRSLGVRGDKFKTEYEGSTGGLSYSGEYFTNNLDDLDNQTVQAQADNIRFSSLKARSFDTESMIRFTLNYYFK